LKADLFQTQLLAYLSGLCAVEVKPDTELFSTGLLNSMKFIQVLSFVQKTLEMEVPNNRLSAEFFNTPDKITTTFCTPKS
jgi:acyl carrier protein